jgi:hypothetical protein
VNPLASLAEPLAGTALARWLQTGWVFPIVESVHILSFALLVGAIAVLDARLLGWLRHVAIVPLMRATLPIAVLGFAGAAASGSLLFVAGAGELVANRAFVVKLGLLMLAGLNVAAFHAGATRAALAADGPPTASMRAAGAASLLLWAAVIVAGRMIAYV